MSFEQQLRDDLRRAGAAAPVEDISWDETLGRARRIRRIYVSMVGAAAAVLVAAGVAAGSSLLDSPQGLPPAHPSPSPAPPPEEGVSLAEVEPTVKAWTHAIDDGRARAAWNLMTAPARPGPGRGRLVRTLPGDGVQRAGGGPGGVRPGRRGPL
jgi:hypothetical protein